MAKLELSDVTVAYRDKKVINGLNLHIPSSKITAVIGANGSGKSTLLKAISRVLPLAQGSIYLDGENINQTPTKVLAKQLAILPQSPWAPEKITVRELVTFGRTPHQGALHQLGKSDKQEIDFALKVTALEEFAHRSVDSLSGGERQRAWIAMAVAQSAKTLILDEPTTFLDIEHQIAVMKLLTRLNRDEDRTVVLSIHDLNLAIQFADHLIVLQQGTIAAQGSPQEVFTEKLLSEVFHVRAEIIKSRASGQIILAPFDLSLEA
jgi:iron complex transport system ATP-binding protein